MKLITDNDGCVTYNSIVARVLDIDGTPVPRVELDFYFYDEVGRLLTEQEEMNEKDRIIYVDPKRDNKTEPVVFSSHSDKFKYIICKKCGKNVCEICGICPYCDEHE